MINTESGIGCALYKHVDGQCTIVHTAITPQTLYTKIWHTCKNKINESETTNKMETDYGMDRDEGRGGAHCLCK